MMPRNRPLLRLLMLLPLLLILGACAQRSSVSVPPPAIPPLPDEARVSKVPIPSVCLPTCTSVVQQTLSHEADTLTRFGSPE